MRTHLAMAHQMQLKIMKQRKYTMLMPVTRYLSGVLRADMKESAHCQALKHLCFVHVQRETHQNASKLCCQELLDLFLHTQKIHSSTRCSLSVLWSCTANIYKAARGST